MLAIYGRGSWVVGRWRQPFHLIGHGQGRPAFFSNSETSGQVRSGQDWTGQDMTMNMTIIIMDGALNSLG